MAIEMLDKTHRIDGGEKPVISARKAAEFLNLSKAVFFTAIDAGIIHWQAKIQDEPDDKPAYGFNIEYLKEVLKTLPKKRAKTQRVFNPTVKAQIEAINKRWYEKTDVDWKKDLRQTKKVMNKGAL